MPEVAPLHVVATSHTSLSSIPVYWTPIPKKFHNGILLSYKIRYRAFKVGDVKVAENPFYTTAEHPHTYEIFTPPNASSFVLTNLSSYTLYRIEVTGVTVKGPGPSGIVFAGSASLLHLKNMFYLNLHSFV